jgi:Fe-S cluster assembly iron-binding protein IscA
MVTLTETAAKVAFVQMAPYLDEPGLGFRVRVMPTSCLSGYDMAIDVQRDGDVTSNQHGLNVYMDEPSAQALQGAIVDFRLMDSGFPAFVLSMPEDPHGQEKTT